MELKIDRESLLKPLQLVIGVVEKRQTLPILGNVLIKSNGQQLSITATDLEIEIVTPLTAIESSITEITFPARKLLDICRTLPEGAVLNIRSKEGRGTILSGKSRFILATLPAEDFPNIDGFKSHTEFTLTQKQFKRLFEKTNFAMAQQDVRYYLNGLLLEVSNDLIRTVATDGHRLALCEEKGAFVIEENQQVIIPRKAVMELTRLLENSDNTVTVQIGNNHIRVTTEQVTFISKLIDGRFPDYLQVVPRNSDKIVKTDRQELRQTLGRASILSNEKYRSIRFNLSNNMLQVLAHNPEKEEAEEELVVDYEGDNLEIGFNANYVIEALGAIESDQVQLELSDQNSCCLIRSVDSADCKYVVMPMRL